MTYLKSKTTWLAVILFAINGLTMASQLPLTGTQLELVNLVLGALVFVNRHYLRSYAV